MKVPTFFVARFSIKEQTLFAKRLSFLVTAGMPILDALSLIRTQTKSKAKKQMLDKIITDVSNGQFLSRSLERIPHLFSRVAIQLIRVGETSGTLSQSLSYLAGELQKKHILTRKIVGALLYPVFITAGTLGVTVLLIMYIFPKILPIFLSLDVTLPLSTRILIGVSWYLSHFGFYTLFFLCFVLVGFVILRKKYIRIEQWEDKALFHTPLAGNLMRAYNVANFSRTLAVLLESGMRLSDALHTLASVTHNTLYISACSEISESLLRGEALSRGLERHPKLFPDTLRHLVAVGESTGTLATSLVYVAELYESEVDEQTKNLSGSVEPVLMVVMGLLVGFVAISVITPMYEITAHLSPR